MNVNSVYAIGYKQIIIIIVTVHLIVDMEMECFFNNNIANVLA